VVTRHAGVAVSQRLNSAADPMASPLPPAPFFQARFIAAFCLHLGRLYFGILGSLVAHWVSHWVSHWIPLEPLGGPWAPYCNIWAPLGGLMKPFGVLQGLDLAALGHHLAA